MDEWLRRLTGKEINCVIHAQVRILLAAIRTSKRASFLDGSIEYFFSQICFEYCVFAVFGVCFFEKKDVELNYYDFFVKTYTFTLKYNSYFLRFKSFGAAMAEWLRRLTRNQM